MKIVNFNHSLSRPLIGTQQKCDYLEHFLVFKVKNVKFHHSLSRTLYGTQQKSDIHRTFFLGFESENSQV